MRRLHARFDNLLWMKLSEIARYWAAKELTRVTRDERGLTFTRAIRLSGVYGERASRRRGEAAFSTAGIVTAAQSGQPADRPDDWQLDSAGSENIFCVDLPKGSSRIAF